LKELQTLNLNDKVIDFWRKLIILGVCMKKDQTEEACSTNGEPKNPFVFVRKILGRKIFGRPRR
jgi:hypothetical protein